MAVLDSLQSKGIVSFRGRARLVKTDHGLADAHPSKWSKVNILQGPSAIWWE
jgi:hypothetical protein